MGFRVSGLFFPTCLADLSDTLQESGTLLVERRFHHRAWARGLGFRVRGAPFFCLKGAPREPDPKSFDAISLCLDPCGWS